MWSSFSYFIAVDLNSSPNPNTPFSSLHKVLDGVDGLITGAETLRGKYPALTISTIAAICRSAEKVFDHSYHYDHLMDLAQVREWVSLLSLIALRVGLSFIPDCPTLTLPALIMHLLTFPHPFCLAGFGDRG